MSVGGLVIVGAVLVRLPADYFSESRSCRFWTNAHPVLRWTGVIVKNVLAAAVSLGLILRYAGRIVIEVDGAQHLSNADAYRRDRRKDRLLQQNAYLVLRFLAEDVSKDLDSVLDSILRSVAGRHRESAKGR